MLADVDARALRRQRREVVAQRTAARDAAGRNAPWRSRWRRLRRRAGDLALRCAAPLAVRLLGWTWRVQRSGDAGLALQRGPGPWLAAMWHGRMLCLMPLRGHANSGLDVLVSPSEDGGLATLALRSFGYRAIRGSLSRGGASAMRAMAAQLAEGGKLVVTPDGPRGPRHAMNSGVPWLARATGAPILPVAVAVDRAWRLRSWDRFTIPKPFARLIVHYGEPVLVPAATDDAELERIGERLAAAILAAERDGFARLDVPCDHAPDDDAASDSAPTTHSAA